MKTKALVCSAILFCSIFSMLHAQVRYVRNIPIQLPYTWMFDPQYTPKQIFSCPDGGFIILGDCQVLAGDPDDPDIGSDAGAIKLDALGNCQWQWWSRDFIGWGHVSIIGIDQDTDGRVNFLISYNDNFKLGWINIQGIHSIQNIQIRGCFINRAIRLPNNDIFAIGIVSISTEQWGNAYFLHLSAQGDSLASGHYPPDSLWIYPGDIHSTAYDMELDTDGMPVTTCTFSDRYASVVKTDWNGNIIWRRDTGSPIFERPIPITKLPDTDEIVFGYHPGLDEDNNYYNIYMITENGIDSLYTIQMSTGYSVGEYYSMVGHDNGIYLSGYFDYQVKISNYNLQGQNEWGWSMNSSNNYYQPTDCITVSPDSCIIHVYGSQYYDDYGLTIIKLHPDGTANDDEVIPKPIQTLSVYPNPTKSIININCISDNCRNKPIIPINIYNIKGQLVKTIALDKKPANQYSAVWDGKDKSGRECSAGTYIIKLKSDNNLITKKIVLLK